VKLVLDSGALVALERNDRAMWRRLKAALAAAEIPTSHGGVIGQVWHGGGAWHELLAMALQGVEVMPLSDALGRAAGELLARSGTSDVIAAALVLLCDDGDDLLTSDLDDLELLVSLADRHVELIRV
jgi:hypothetical protein